MIKFDILTIFPQIFHSYLAEALLKRAQEKEVIQIIVHNLRDYAKDRHRTTDDKPFGGGPGMVMMLEPIFCALQNIVPHHLKFLLNKKREKREEVKIVLLSAKGIQFTQERAEEWSKIKRLVLICGRYEGVDERVKKYLVDEEISIGPYILSGGELASLVIIETVTRLIPCVLGNEESLREESFGKFQKEYPQYTRPAVFSPYPGVEWRVPKVLLSGNHQKIKEWRERGARKRVKVLKV